MPYQAQNNATIKRAFTRLQSTEQKTCSAGIKLLAKAGLDYLVDAHNAQKADLHHVGETDTLAYAVAHDGVIVATGFHNGGDADLPGSAVQKASDLLAGTEGWVAVILSDMEGWYRVDWEMNFLYRSVEDIKRNFHSFFKKVA